MPPKKGTLAASNDGILPKDVLLLLPAKMLCRFRAVCRSWRSLLSNPLFVAAHKSHHPEPLIVSCDCAMFKRGVIDIMDFSGLVKRIDTSMVEATVMRTRLDLICVAGRNYYTSGHVINPATGDTFALPSGRSEEHANVEGFVSVESFDFGQVVSTGEYMALRCLSIDSSGHESKLMLCEFITLDGSHRARWRGEQGPPAPVTSNWKKSTAVNGDMEFVYILLDFVSKRFTCNGDRVEPGSIASFNLETEEWMAILRGPIPVRSFVEDSDGRVGYFGLYSDLSLVNLNGFLVMVHNSLEMSLDLWFLMDFDKCVCDEKYSIGFQRENLFAQLLLVLNDGRIALEAFQHLY